MLKVSVVCVGKLKEKYLKDAVAEYSKRLTSFCKFEIIEVDVYVVRIRPFYNIIGFTMSTIYDITCKPFR